VAARRRAWRKAAASVDRRDANQDVEALRSELDALRKDMGARMALARAASNGGRDAMEDFSALRRAEAELDAMRERIATIGNELQATGQQQSRNEGKIEERPYASLALAFAIGFVVSRVLDRR
jgi:ElaB/YqjD/DUF883 family membrane-anchored ribosome-binding protein